MNPYPNEIKHHTTNWKAETFSSGERITKVKFRQIAVFNEARSSLGEKFM